jgi:hypothetical protein
MIRPSRPVSLLFRFLFSLSTIVAWDKGKALQG